MTSLIRYFLAAALGVATLATTGVASASLIDAIGALDRGAPYRVVFVTSTIHNATSTDISVYNDFISTTADSPGSITASLELSWLALASTAGVSAEANTGISASDSTTVTFFNTQGDVLATSGSDLFDGSLLSGVVYDEYGVATSTLVWTGSTANGTGFAGRQLGTSLPELGASPSSGSDWMVAARIPASSAVPLYGVSVLAKAPVPPSPVLVLVGLTSILGVSRRGRDRPAA